jgi:prepilin-type N-terminal cleavage/methylation domain-containing protein
MTDSKPYTSSSLLKNRGGFTLLELILVMVLVGIAAVMVVPFVGNVLSNLLEGRELSQRESQAVLAPERFVRDVRMADSVDFVNSQEITLTLDGIGATYLIYSGSLLLDGQPLAKHVTAESSFSKIDIADFDGFSVITLDLIIQLSGGGKFELSTSAVLR